MPNPHCTSWVPLQWQATNSWAGLLPSSGVNGYHRVILLPGSPFYLEQVAAQCPFLLPHFGYLSSHCLSACRERRRTTCTEDVLWVYCDPSVIWAVLLPKDLSALYQHPGFFLTSHPCEAYQGTGSQTCCKHILVQSVINADHSVTPSSVASSLSHTHISTHISARPAVVFLHLQLHAYLMHGVFSQIIIAAGKGLLALVRLRQQQMKHVLGPLWLPCSSAAQMQPGLLLRACSTARAQQQ